MKRALFILFALLVGCVNTQPQDASEQRRIGETSFEDGVRLLLSFGTFRRVDGDPIIARAASPRMRLTIRSGPVPSTSRNFEVRNVGPNATLKVLSVAVLTSEVEDGCEFGNPRTVLCENAPTFENCGAAEFARSETNPTTINFTYDPVGCREVVFEFSEEDAVTDSLTAVVMGPSESLDTIEAAAVIATEENADFMVLLGDATTSVDAEGLSNLEATTNTLSLPVVLIAGDQEQGVDAGGGFLRRFGPHEHSWNQKGAKFFTFFSATGSLGEAGIDRLDTTLAQLQRRADNALPIIGFTHIPPLDVEGTRDAGFRNQLEGARVQAILKRYDVAMLFSGESVNVGYEKTGNLEVILTGWGSDVLTDERQLVILRVRHKDDGSEGRLVGNHRIDFERRRF